MNCAVLDFEIHEKQPPGFCSLAQAVGCYIEIEGKLLLLQYSEEKVNRGKWNVPGGKLQEKETLQEGALRELAEETGILLNHITSIEHIASLYVRKKELDYIYHQFKIELFAIPPLKLSSEHQSYIWASSEQLNTLPLVERGHDVLALYHSALLKKNTRVSVNAYLILRNHDRVLFHLRKNTGYCDGMWSLVAGHVEEGESATQAILRETGEEIGLNLLSTQVKAVHVMHRKSDRFNVDIFFDCPLWDGIVANCEPEKCAQLEFFSLCNLPSPLIDYIGVAFNHIEKAIPYSEYGWEPC